MLDVNMIIANNIQAELKKENKKQVDLAEGIGVSKQTMEALQMLIGGFVIFMIPQVVGSVVVFLELVAATIRQVWYI